MARSTSSSGPLTVRCRGVRGSTPVAQPEMLRYGGNTSCVEVRCGDELLILDAGTGIRSLGDDLLNEFSAGSLKANLLISHTHWDHIQGLPFFAPGYSARNRIRLHVAHGRAAAVERALQNQMSPAHFPVALDKMQGLSRVEELACGQTQLGRFLIQTTDLNHPGGCAGFRIEAAGASMAYLPDHEPYVADGPDGDRQAALIEFVQDVDLLILDSQYTEAEYARHIGWGHGSLPESVAMAVQARARRLMLFHHDPSHDDGEIDLMVATAQELVGGAPLAVQGAIENEIISLGARRLQEISAASHTFAKIAVA